MVLRSPPLVVLFLAYPWMISGYTIMPGRGRNAVRSASEKSRRLYQSNTNGEDDQVSTLLSARKARVIFPMSSIIAALAGNSLPAHAGIGTVVPFEETRKEKFSGSIANSVVILRLKSSLRKRGYFQNKSLIATFKASDDLGVSISREFGDGQVIDVTDGAVLEEYIEKCQSADKKAVVLYGQDVDISANGEASQVLGKDLKSSENLLMEKLRDKLSEVTLVGGVVIHRSKSGGKDAGEDCFLPVAITCTRNGITTDIFEEVFGDLPTPRQTVSLKGL